MKLEMKLKKIWMIVTVMSLILLGFHWFDYQPRNLEIALVVLNGMAFALSVPCSLFLIPVMVTANYYLAINPVTNEGVYLNTFFLLALGMMQWFFVVKFWLPKEPTMQILDLADGSTN